MSQHAKKVIDQLCNYLGYDLESPMCKELHDHLQKCPECQDYVDSVKKTVKLHQNACKEAEVPLEVKLELFKKLKLNKKETDKQGK